MLLVVPMEVLKEITSENKQKPNTKPNLKNKEEKDSSSFNSFSFAGLLEVTRN